MHVIVPFVIKLAIVEWSGQDGLLDTFSTRWLFLDIFSARWLLLDTVQVNYFCEDSVSAPR